MRITKTLLALMVVGSAVAFVATPAYAQQAGAGSETKSAKGRGTGPDENIKMGRAANKADANVPAPASKGGDKTRGSGSIVHVDNHTNWYIDVYMDGSYCSTVSPWGDSYCYVGSGSTRFYGKADFTDGSSLTWGPLVQSVDGTFTWKLWP